MWIGSLQETCTVLNLTPQRVNQLVKNGTLPRISRGKYDVILVNHAYIRYLQNIAGQGGKSLSEERTRLTRVQADHEELKLLKAKGVLIHTDTALEIWGLVISAFKSKIESVAIRLNPIIDNIKTKADKTEVKEEIETLHKEALHELSNIKSADYADDRQDGETGEAPAKSNDKRVGGRKKVSKPRVVKRARKVANKKG